MEHNSEIIKGKMGNLCVFETGCYSLTSKMLEINKFFASQSGNQYSAILQFFK